MTAHRIRTARGEDPHRWLVAAGYLRRGRTVEQVAIDTRLSIDAVREIARRIET